MSNLFKSRGQRVAEGCTVLIGGCLVQIIIWAVMGAVVVGAGYGVLHLLGVV